MPKNEIDTIASRLALADALLAAVKESGLLKKARRAVRSKRRAPKAKAAAAPKKRGTKTANPLSKVPSEPAAA